MRTINEILIDQAASQIKAGKNVNNDQAQAFENKKIQQQLLKEQEEVRKAQKKSQG